MTTLMVAIDDPKKTVNSTEIGNRLEDKFYDYLCEQQMRDELVFGAYPSELCKIYKQKKYWCKIRENFVTFDVVIELYRKDRTKPHIRVVFECKNHGRNIEEDRISAFSKKLGRLFEHGAKGVIVTSSPLQSGAEKVALNSKMGIVKYDQHGFDVVVDRTGKTLAESKFTKRQIFENKNHIKSLKFSGYYNNKFHGSINTFFQSLVGNIKDSKKLSNEVIKVKIPYLDTKDIQQHTKSLLEKIEYNGGAVDLPKICSILSLSLKFTQQAITDERGNAILGQANFDRKSVQIYYHQNSKRERFTIAHEIGHFCLGHDKYLRSETVVENDLLLNHHKKHLFNYRALEFQANIFASELLIPENWFFLKTKEAREEIGIKDRGYGYIYVDDQPSNLADYFQLLTNLSTYFDTSKQAIEIKLKKLKMLTDSRIESQHFKN